MIGAKHGVHHACTMCAPSVHRNGACADVNGGRGQRSVGPASGPVPVASVPFPDLFADQAVVAVGRGADILGEPEPFGRHDPRDFEDELAPDGFGEFRPFPDRDHESAGAADHAVFVIEVEVIEVPLHAVAVPGHQRQAVDGDPLVQDLAAGGGDGEAGVVRAIARDVDDAPEPVKDVGVEAFGGIGHDAGDRGAAECGVEMGFDPVSEGGEVVMVADKRPVDHDALGMAAGPFDIGERDLPDEPACDGMGDVAGAERLGISTPLDFQFGRGHGAGDVDGEE